MKDISEVRSTKQTVEVDLLKQRGVTGVDIGYKYVGGKKTDVLAIRVYVKEKKDVPKKEEIPKVIKGVKTDVIQRKFVLHPLCAPLAEVGIKADTANYDPLRGGISIGPCRAIGGYVYTGTLGAIVRDNVSGNPMLLSNFHVMCVDNGWSVGDTMAQPSRPDGGICPADVVGTLQRASLGGKVDCAVASHAARGYACSIEDIGLLMYPGTAMASEGLAVRKRGRTTGLTYGIVDTVDLTVKIDYGDGLGEVTLTNQIGIEVDSTQNPQFGISGDSGSVVVNDERKVVGLYFAGNMEETDAQGNVIVPEGTYGVANPIQAVLDALNVRICAEVAKKVEPEPVKWWIDHKAKPEYEGEWQKEFEKWKELDKPEKWKEFYKPEKWKELDKPEKWKPERYKREKIPTTEPMLPVPGSTLEERLARLEAAVEGWRSESEKFKPELKPEWYKPGPELYKPPEQVKPESYKPELKPEWHKPGPELYKPPEQVKPESYKPELKPVLYQRKNNPTSRTNPPVSHAALEERLARLETAIANLTHFIRPEFRPDLSKGALREEPDLC